MREAIAWHLFSGHAWFTAGGVLIAIALLDLSRLFSRHAIAASAARVTGLVACGIAAMSGTPVNPWLAAAATAALAAFLFFTIGSPRDAVRRGVAATALLVTVAALALEAPYHAPAPTARASSRPLVVIGDSLASRGFGESAPWPEILASDVVNLSRPSEDVSLALRDSVPTLAQAPAGAVVILEVGGNDMLGGTPVARFERDLRALALAARGLHGARRELVMLELPLLPGKWRFGAAQRRVAASSGTVLVPKRVLARVLTRPANTSDGLHLTQHGHEELARAVAPWIP